MYSPVRRCQKNELSDKLPTPTAHPNSPNTAVKTAPRPRLDPRWGATGASTGSDVTGGGVAARVSVGVAVMPCRPLERPRDLDERGAEDDDEDRREDAEHQREQHLHWRLLRELLST